MKSRKRRRNGRKMGKKQRFSKVTAGEKGKKKGEKKKEERNGRKMRRKSRNFSKCSSWNKRKKGRRF